MSSDPLKISFYSGRHEGDGPSREASHGGIRLHRNLCFCVSSSGRRHSGSIYVTFTLDNGVTTCSYATWRIHYHHVLDVIATSTEEKIRPSKFSDDYVVYQGLGLRVAVCCSQTWNRSHIFSLVKLLGPVASTPRLGLFGCDHGDCRILDVNELGELV